MDLEPSTLLAGILVSAVGLGLFLYGKKQLRWPQLATGLVLMACPYFAGGATVVLAIGGGLVAALWMGLRFGL